MKTGMMAGIAGAVLMMSAAVFGEESSITSLVDTGRMEQVLGKGWIRDRNMVVESEQGIAKLKGVEKDNAETVFKLMKPHGIVACGEFSFSRAEEPLNSLAVKVFKFSSSDKAAAFRKMKYESDQARPLYKRTETKTAVIYDSLEMKKRIIFTGVFWVTCGHIQDDDQHLKILESCVKLGTTGKEQ